jgi:hypothetical protein
MQLLIAREYARLLIADARAAKANGRPSVVAFYIKKARTAMRDARAGRFYTMQLTIA